MSLKQVLCKIGIIRGNSYVNVIHYQQSVGYNGRIYDNYIHKGVNWSLQLKLRWDFSPKFQNNSAL